MSPITPAVQEFFDLYAQSRTVLDIDLITSQYPDSIMFAGPSGASVTEKVAILAAFPKGQEFLKAHGHRPTKVLSLDETRLDDHYVLVRAQFGWRFDKSSAQPIDVKSTPRSSCISMMVSPRLSFNMSAKIPSRHCERAACYQLRHRLH